MKCDCPLPCESCECLSTLPLVSKKIQRPPSAALIAQKEQKQLTPMKAIRHKCLDCCCGSFLEVKLCTVIGCALHRYRFGRRPVKGGEECG